jgi:hypothetical protein
VFPDTEVPRDFDTIDVPLPERGAPQLAHWEPARRPAPRTPAPSDAPA